MSKRKRTSTVYSTVKDSILHSLLDYDNWIEIESKLDVLDLFMLVMTSQKINHCIKEHIKTYKGFYLAILSACRPCGSLIFSHSCERSRVSFPCATNRVVRSIPGSNSRSDDFHCLSQFECKSISFLTITKNNYAVFRVETKDILPFNWGHGHTFYCNYYCFIAFPLGKKATTLITYYHNSDGSDKANGIYNAILHSRSDMSIDKEIIADRVLSKCTNNEPLLL